MHRIKPFSDAFKEETFKEFVLNERPGRKRLILLDQRTKTSRFINEKSEKFNCNPSEILSLLIA